MSHNSTIARIGSAGQSPRRPLSFLAPDPRNNAISPPDVTADAIAGQNPSQEPEMPPEVLAFVAKLDANNAWQEALADWRHARANHAKRPGWETRAALDRAMRKARQVKPALFEVVE